MPFDILRQSREPPSESEAFEQVIKREFVGAEASRTCADNLHALFSVLIYINITKIHFQYISLIDRNVSDFF